MTYLIYEFEDGTRTGSYMEALERGNFKTIFFEYNHRDKLLEDSDILLDPNYEPGVIY